MKIYEEYYDVVVVGSGGGGLRAAIGAAQAGAGVLVLGRGKSNRSGATLLAGANISADIACDGASLSRLGISDDNKNDSKDQWFEDLVTEGFHLNNQRMVELFTDTAGDRVGEMLDWGLKVLGMEGPREISVSGSDILDVLYKKAVGLGVKFCSDVQFTDLALKDGEVKGAVCLNLLEGELCCYPAGAVVLATGGAHGLFPFNSGSTDLCGEGQAAALRAGAELVDMEMISFCPTVITHPAMYKGNILPYILFSTGYGNLHNKFGKPFTHKYLSPQVEKLALETEWNKMLLSYALQKEINAGGKNRLGGIYYNLDLHPAEILEELYQDLPPLKSGIYADIMSIFESGHSVTVLPSAHYFEGGIRVNEQMETCIPGLYAAGECAGGMFGANRVSAATTEMLVEGARAGENAARFAMGRTAGAPGFSGLDALEEELTRPFGGSGRTDVRQALSGLQKAVGKSLSVLRSSQGLEEGLKTAEHIAKEALPDISFGNKNSVYNREWMDYLSLRNMTVTAQAILHSAQLRRESRGVHIREDCDFTDNQAFLGNFVIKGLDFNHRFEPLGDGRLKPELIKQPYTAYVEQIVAQLESEERQ